ncbi:DUF3038 domain-containing protein [Phormidium sp. CLA17]|uniref:DUF3038 domain-containing protein n=1 Tax=Leptolyngbya sp. Cla-17 TaxID=2803751 RepID=UPI001490FD93|nr:DUF3038 domain-containing protein [Leptolyngbya sp. Cla-17]MBM0742542.1 DUF3038 domain-containing protein [Leptolyngbya sp. Cla-17]
MQLNSPLVQPSSPVILSSLPNPPIAEQTCPRRARIEIDLLLLAIEALELDGSEAILQTSKELGLDEIIKDRVTLWRLRNTNPLRRHNQRRELTLTEAKALVVVGCSLSRQLTVLIRQLLIAYDQLTEKQLSMEHHFRLNDYLERFRAHFRSRMNPRRAAVADNYSDEKLNQLALNLLSQLLFCTGTYGIQRFWFSLFDGEVA